MKAWITTTQVRCDRCFDENGNECCVNTTKKEQTLTLGNGKLRNFTEGFQVRLPRKGVLIESQIINKIVLLAEHWIYLQVLKWCVSLSCKNGLGVLRSCS